MFCGKFHTSSTHSVYPLYKPTLFLPQRLRGGFHLENDWDLPCRLLAQELIVVLVWTKLLSQTHAPPSPHPGSNPCLQYFQVTQPSNSTISSLQGTIKGNNTQHFRCPTTWVHPGWGRAGLQIRRQQERVLPFAPLYYGRGTIGAISYSAKGYRIVIVCPNLFVQMYGGWKVQNIVQQMCVTWVLGTTSHLGIVCLFACIKCTDLLQHKWKIHE